MFEVDTIAAAILSRRREMPVVLETPSGKKLAHPAARSPRIFADTADIEAIRPLFEAGIIDGVTTNPTLLKKAGAKSWDEAKERMTEILRLFDPYPVSLELTKVTPDEMLAQAQELSALGPNGVIKVPVGGFTKLDPNLDPYTGLKVLRKLWERDIKTNATLIFNSTQAFWAAKAGATYVSPFLGRLADYLYKHDEPELPTGNSLYNIVHHKKLEEGEFAYNSEYVASGGPRKDAGVRLVREIVAIFANYDIHSEVLAASFRNFSQLTEVLLAGADILTVPAEILAEVCNHPLSDEGMVQFNTDAQAFTT
jgi:transaldolase